ncbi:DUF4465 domain-containing protein [Tautonia marina]|uniref:DUF4465 domain-containing protein n=1 Tax=Tautonia marina TaxID=2653855 RepID=UPI001375F77D|nr:DUF4465 domain-containing protein [Tautonia marina]
MMVSRFSLAVALWLVLAPMAARAESLSVDFSDLTLGSESFNNGSDGAGGFSSNGVFFRNSYNPTWQTWSGWSYSNQTDNTTAGFGNQFSSFAGGDASGDGIYAVAYGQSPSSVRFDLPELDPHRSPVSMSASFTNTTYAALSMQNGDAFSKKFGGSTGNDPDFFLLTIVGYSGLGASGDIIGEVDFYLADFRFDDSSLDSIVQDWTTVDLSTLIGARSIGFRLTSSDVGTFGMNTPAYFAMDDFSIRFSVIPEPASIAMFGVGLAGAVAIVRRRRGRIV